MAKKKIGTETSFKKFLKDTQKEYEAKAAIKKIRKKLKITARYKVVFLGDFLPEGFDLPKK